MNLKFHQFCSINKFEEYLPRVGVVSLKGSDLNSPRRMVMALIWHLKEILAHQPSSSH